MMAHMGVRLAAILAGLLFVLPSGNAQTTAQDELLAKARLLEAEGHPEMASQLWQQELLSDPRNAEALAGLARASERAGDQRQARIYLDRLRQAQPGSTQKAAARGAAPLPTEAQSEALAAQAAKLAAAGRYEQAMQLYRQAFGQTPPAGEWALAYYETEAATGSGLEHGIAGLRSLAKMYPGDSRYEINLGKILTYKPKTRSEGITILEHYRQDADARAALTTALGWEAEDPAAASALRDYLKHDQDPELARALEEKSAEAKAARSGSGQQSNKFAQPPEMRAAYEALAAGRLEQAESSFESLVQSDRDRADALAGLGFVQMKQRDFARAAESFEQAGKAGARRPEVVSALRTARF